MEVTLALLQPMVALLLYITDVGLVVGCAAVHLQRGTSYWHGGITVAIFCLAGWVTNGFNFYRHVRRRMSQVSRLKWTCTMLGLLVPSKALLDWIVEWAKSPSCWMANYWVATLRLFYSTTGSLVQAVFQAYVIITLWWDATVDPTDFKVMVAGAVFLAAHAMLGVCAFIWKEHFEEEHEEPHKKDFVFIIASVTLNMGGRIASMAMVAAVVSFWWMVAAIAAPICLNYGMCLYTTQPQDGGSKVKQFARCTLPLPVAILYSLSVPPEKIAMVVTSGLWLVMSLPQVQQHHSTVVQVVAWMVPFIAQVIALVLMLLKWTIFKNSFARFERLLSEHIQRQNTVLNEKKNSNNCVKFHSVRLTSYDE